MNPARIHNPDDAASRSKAAAILPATVLMSLALLALAGSMAYLWLSPAPVRVLGYDVEGPHLYPTKRRTAGQVFRYRLVLGPFTIYRDR